MFKFRIRNFSLLNQSYEQLIKDKGLKDSKYQRNLISVLEAVVGKIQRPSFLSKLGYQTTKGVYIHGSVGCGKTMIMDLFHKTYPMERMLRIHFHEFMRQIHKDLHEIRQNSTQRKTDPIEIVANKVSLKYKIILFDEFQVVDITDAMILKIFFQHLFDRNLIMIATSNRKPEDLYKNGLSRINFLPFIDLLKEKCTIFDMKSSTDYRLENKLETTKSSYYNKRYFVSCDVKEAREYFTSISINGKSEPRTLTVNGRELNFHNCSNGIVFLSFQDICEKPLGPTDYLRLCENFHTIILHSVPQLTISKMSATRRFISLVDVIYDKMRRLVIFSEQPIESLFNPEDGPKVEASISHRQLFDDLNVSDKNIQESVITNEEEKFAFSRTLSRLHEIETDQYWDKSDTKI